MNGVERFTPLINLPWIKWIDRSELPTIVIGVITLGVFLPFYDWGGLAPQMPLEAGAFPPAFALVLAFLLLLTRGATRDLQQLVHANKIDASELEQLGASKRWARLELIVGLAIGLERTYAQLMYAGRGELDPGALLSAGGAAVAFAIIAYTVVQIHLLGFCVRQVITFRRVAGSFDVDLMTPELNNALSNPLIRFMVVGLVALSFAMLILQVIPFSSQQARLIEAALMGGLIWVVLIVVSFVPLLTLKSRIAIAKAMEINVIRNALRGDFSGADRSQFGNRLKDFSPADLMFYEDRIKNIWEWPVEGHIRRLIIFGLLPPLTWVLAAGVEIIFESVLLG